MSPLRSVSDAVVRLGTRTVRNVVVTVSMQSQFKSPELYGHDGHSFMEHAIGTAYVAHLIADKSRADVEESVPLRAAARHRQAGDPEDRAPVPAEARAPSSAPTNCRRRCRRASCGVRRAGAGLLERARRSARRGAVPPRLRAGRRSAGRGGLLRRQPAQPSLRLRLPAGRRRGARGCRCSATSISTTRGSRKADVRAPGLFNAARQALG